MAKLHFHGVAEDEALVGCIKSEELIREFNDTWLPLYQRGKVPSKVKEKELIEVYRTHGPMDAITLNMVSGDYKVVSHKDAILLLEGEFHVVDGQQRLRALAQSGVTDFPMKANVYLGLEYKQALDYFLQLNDKSTKLTMAGIIRAYDSPISKMLRRVLASKIYPVPMDLNSARKGLTAASFCTLLYFLHHRLFKKQLVAMIPNGPVLKNFAANTTFKSESDVTKLEWSIKNLLAKYVEIFGYYDRLAVTFSRPFLMSWNHLIIDFFVQDTGAIDYGSFEKKISQVEGLVKNAYTKELIKDNSSNFGHRRLYQYLLDNHFNWKKRADSRLVAQVTEPRIRVPVGGGVAARN